MLRPSFFLLTLLSVPFAFARVPVHNQVPSEAQQAQAPANSNSSSVVSSNGNLFESTTSEKFADRVFDTNNDSVDWDNGSINWKGKTYSIGNSRVVRARFERYLATDMTSEGIADYKDIIAEIVAVMSTQNVDANITTLKYAWNLLFEAGEFVYDGDSSVSIANSVDNVWRMKSDYQGLKRNADETEKGRDDAMHSAIRASNYLEKRGLNTSSSQASANTGGGGKGGKDGGKGGRGSAPSSNSGVDNAASGPLPLFTSSDVLYATKEIATKEAQLKKDQATASAVGAKAVIQYQSMVVSFLMARRFSHAAIACDFYRELFKGSKQDFQVGKKELEEMVPISNLIPSTDLIQGIAHEGRNDVILGMQAVNTLFEKGERYSALQRLMETFFLGEHEADVMSFPYDKKQILYSIYRDASTIKDLADIRDLEGIEKAIASIEKNASDFPVAEIMAKVNSAKSASNLKIFAAKQSAMMGDVEGVEKNITDATTFWPLNPKIEEFNNEIMEMATGSALHTKNFERLLAEGNYRAIATDAVELAMVYRNDSATLDLIKDIVKKIGSIDMLIAQADEFQKQNNHYFAWELLENAMLIDKNDIVLARAVADLAPMVADYVRLMNTAKLAEKNKNYPEALINFLRAKEISPTSQVCRLAIERLSKLYLRDN
ncbi:MAG: hypothetical protein R3Y46_01010 [Opitutales bacterium]